MLSGLIGIQVKDDTLIASEQYEEISALIYHTDPYIYPALFGEGNSGIKNARAILPRLFQSKVDKMFKKDRLFLYMDGDQIIGLILWCESPLEWEPAPLLFAADELGIPLEIKQVMAVAKEYVDVRYANDSPERLLAADVVSLVNVCVSPRWRGKGIGTAMLNSFFAQHTAKRYSLCVLADNRPAINLYQSMGFVITRENSPGFSLTRDKPMCLEMEKTDE